MSRETELLICENLFSNKKYAEKVSIYIKPEYFANRDIAIVMGETIKYFNEYDALPSLDTLEIIVSETNGIQSEEIQGALDVISDIRKQSRTGVHDFVWMVEKTEKHFRERACFIAIGQSIDIFDGTDKKTPVGSVPELLSKAVSLKFDNRLTHSVSDDPVAFYETHYEKKVHKLPMHLETFNRITKGGLERKSFVMFISNQTGGFKTGLMCDWSANLWKMGYSCLYITFEMSENKIRERFDANLLDVELDDLKLIPKMEYGERMKKISSMTKGRLEIKEWPEYGAHSGHIRYLLKELARTKGFRPDFIFVDYINLARSQLLSGSKDTKEHRELEVISKELRAIGKEFDCCVVTATQSNRSGHRAKQSNFEVDQIGESYAMGFTGDLILGIINNVDLEEQNLLMFKQFKNRWAGKSDLNVFSLRCVRAKMKLSDLKHNEETGVMEDAKKPMTMLEKRQTNRESSFDDWKI